MSVVIIGAGETGTRAALTLRQKDYDDAITLIGAEPAPPYERPPVSKSVISGEADEPPVIATAKALSEKNIDFSSETVVKKIHISSSAVSLDNGETIGFDQLLISTGARARPLSMDGIGDCILLRSRADALALRDKLSSGTKLVIIGGGFIGLELAASTLAHEASVTVIEKAPHLMGRAVPASIAEIVQKRHEQAGIEILIDQDVGEFDGLEDADLVVAGIGAIPETGLAEDAGLEIENGIKVDGTLRTSHPSIFAAGDCCSFPHPLFNGDRIRLESWRNALDQAEHVAGAIMGDEADYQAVPWFWSEQHDMVLQIAGLAQLAEEKIVRKLGENSLIEFGLDQEGRLVAASGIAEGNKIAKEIRVAEMMIAKRLSPKPSDLEDCNVSLKSLLRQ